MTLLPRAAVSAAALGAANVASAAPGVEIADLSSVVLSLALVVGFIFAAAYIARRSPFGALARKEGPLKVIAALSLGPKERLLLVDAQGSQLLIVVSPAGVFNVGSPAPQQNAATPPPKFTLGAAQ